MFLGQFIALQCMHNEFDDQWKVDVENYTNDRCLVAPDNTNAKNTEWPLGSEHGIMSATLVYRPINFSGFDATNSDDTSPE